MEKSASAPGGKVLEDSDYYLPCHGIGDTGPAQRVILGNFSKDDGSCSSRINQIERQAKKYPGPGKYLAHASWAGEDGRSSWGIHGGNKFGHGSREYKPLHKFPDPRHYERKDIFSSISNASKDNLSKNPRVIHGKIPKGKCRSFLDQAIRHASDSPAPGHYHQSTKIAANRMDPRIIKITEWKKEMDKSTSRSTKKVEEPAPNHYKPNWSPTEESTQKYSVPKELASNFLDKATKEKMVDPRKKIPLPGPGSYDLQNFDLSKTSRGTFHMQLRGMTRSPASGYF